MITAINQLIPGIGVIFSFPTERALFLREYQDGYYSTSTYFLSKVTVDIPFQILFATIFSSISYNIIGLQPSVIKYLLYNLTTIILSLVGSSIGFILSAYTGNIQASLSIAPMIFLTLMLFSGFIVTIENIIWPLRAIAYINPFRYGFNILMKNEFSGLKALLFF